MMIAVMAVVIIMTLIIMIIQKCYVIRNVQLIFCNNSLLILSYLTTLSVVYIRPIITSNDEISE
jgi:hypothetical protein